MNSPLTIDARGHRCPIPSLMLRKAILASHEGGLFVLLATDPMARIDIPYLMGEMGGSVVAIDEADGTLTITVETPGAPTG